VACFLLELSALSFVQSWCGDCSVPCCSSFLLMHYLAQCWCSFSLQFAVDLVRLTVSAVISSLQNVPDTARTLNYTSIYILSKYVITSLCSLLPPILWPMTLECPLITQYFRSYRATVSDLRLVVLLITFLMFYCVLHWLIWAN